MNKQTKQRFNLTLSPNIVKRTNDLLKPYGGKLSSLIDQLLIDWIHVQEEFEDFKKSFEKEKELMKKGINGKKKPLTKTEKNLEKIKNRLDSAILPKIKSEGEK